DLWRPVDRSDPRIESRGWHTLAVAGRLAPNATLDDAARDAEGVAERRAREFPEHYVRRNGAIVDLPIVSLQEATVGSARDAFRLLLAAVTLLLLVACANVAHLFMARGLGRSREMAVRRALGAGTPVLAGQLLTESLLVAGGAAAVGTLLAAAGLRAFLLLTPEALPRATSVVLDGRVLAFAVALASLTAIAFGLLPTLRVAGRERNDPLRAGGRGSTGGRGFSALRTGLIVTEVALSLVLVSSAGLLIRSFARLNDQPLGFSTEDVWTLPLRLTGEEDPEGWQRRMDGIAGAMERVPGVLSVTYAESVPLEHTGGERCCWSEAIRLERAEQGTEAMIHASGGGSIDVFQLRSVAGRPWTAAEARAHPAPALLNETLAVELFGSTNGALGREILLSETPHGVVGVLADDRHYGPDQEHGPAAYVPIESVPFVLGDAHVAVRVESGASDLPRRLREAVWSVEPDLPVPLVRSMDHWAELATARTRFDSILFGGFGVVALLLAAGGLYGTLLYTVGMERRELGIRLALGASRRKVEARVLGRGLRAALAGVVLGGAAAWSSGRLLQNRLFDVQGGDLVTLAAAAGVLLGTAAVASWVPARRAARTDPLETLRQE
ncbi:MAG TPA: FtsX-like permease family protein, partial [Longimicrobiales bacterium]|nr:FtsX-like permease family protein [Longimicrobiales bacterium]